MQRGILSLLLLVGLACCLSLPQGAWSANSLPRLRQSLLETVERSQVQTTLAVKLHIFRWYRSDGRHDVSKEAAQAPATLTDFQKGHLKNNIFKATISVEAPVTAEKILAKMDKINTKVSYFHLIPKAKGNKLFNMINKDSGELALEEGDALVYTEDYDSNSVPLLLFEAPDSDTELTFYQEEEKLDEGDLSPAQSAALTNKAVFKKIIYVINPVTSAKLATATEDVAAAISRFRILPASQYDRNFGRVIDPQNTHEFELSANTVIEYRAGTENRGDRKKDQLLNSGI